GEGLLERATDRRLPHVQRLDLADLHLRARLELAPAELGEVARAADGRGGSRDQRLWAAQVAEGRLDLGVDLPHEERVRADLPADLVERGHEEGRATHPLAVPLLIERGVELVSSGAEQRAGPLL